MGVVNVTPDSFSDGGRCATPDAAVAHGLRLLADGADLLDIGGESTRPGATRPAGLRGAGRVVPVINELAAAGRHGLGRHDARRGGRGRPRCRRGSSTTSPAAWPTLTCWSWPAPGVVRRDALAGARRPDAPQRDVRPGGWSTEVVEELAERVAAALAAGIAADRLALDPGLGFAKTPATPTGSCSATSTTSTSLGHRVLVGASRKSFLGALLAGADGTAAPGRASVRSPASRSRWLLARRASGGPGPRRTACRDALGVSR